MSLQPAIKNSKKKRKMMVEDLIGESSQAVKIEGRDTTDKMTNTGDDDEKTATSTSEEAAEKAIHQSQGVR